MFSEKLKELRKEKGVSQEELSEILDVSRQSISKYENGTSEPNFEKLLILAKYFNLSVDELLGSTPGEKRGKSKNVNTGNHRILIESQIVDKASSFYKFIVNPVVGKKKYQPGIMMLGVDGHHFWGDSSLPLAWYATKDDYEKELQAILLAISNGEISYDLKYYTNVEKKGIFDLKMSK